MWRFLKGLVLQAVEKTLPTWKGKGSSTADEWLLQTSETKRAQRSIHQRHKHLENKCIMRHKIRNTLNNFCPPLKFFIRKGFEEAYECKNLS